MPSILAAVITWEEAAVEHLEASTDQDVDVEDAGPAEQTIGVLAVPCAPTAKEDSVPQLLAQDAILAAALVSPSLVSLAPRSTTLAVNVAKRRHHLESASGHACGHAAVPAHHPSLSLNL